MTTEPLSKESQPTSETEPKSAEGKRAMEQAHDAIENVSDGYGDSVGAKPPDVAAPAAAGTAATPTTPGTPAKPGARDTRVRFESPGERGTEATHVPVRDADRR